MYHVNITDADKHRFELVVSGKAELSAFQDKLLSKVIFLWLDSAGRVFQDVFTGFNAVDQSCDEESEPKYTAEIEGSCVLRIFDEAELYRDKKLIYVLVETFDGDLLTVAAKTVRWSTTSRLKPEACKGLD